MTRPRESRIRDDDSHSHSRPPLPGRTTLVVALVALAWLAGCSQQGAPAPESGEDRPEVAGTASTRESPSRGGTAGPTVAERSSTVRFGVAGDLGANAYASRGLRRIDQSDLDLFWGIGDIDYDQTATDREWCRYVTDRLPTQGADFPFELLAGNHEEDGGPDGRMANFTACLPDRLDSRGAYGAQYTFRYPATDPLVAFVGISPDLTVAGHAYDYRSGSPDREWLDARLRAARADGVPWVVLAMHKPCYSRGAAHDCEGGAAAMNAAVAGGADLIVAGHNHLYERSKQIARGSDCARLRVATYDADCVVDGGADGAYRKGAGTVQVTSGRFGGRANRFAAADPDARWFRYAADDTTGWTKFVATRSRLEARYVATSGTARDTFVID